MREPKSSRSSRTAGEVVSIAILIGCKVALENGCSAVVLIDSQGEPFVREMFRVASPVLSGKADLVIGSRQFFGRKTIPPYSPDAVTEPALPLKDRRSVSEHRSHSRFRALSIEAISLLDLLPDSDLFEPTMITLFSHRGLAIKEIPIVLKNERPRRGNEDLPLYPSTPCCCCCPGVQRGAVDRGDSFRDSRFRCERIRRE